MLLSELNAKIDALNENKRKFLDLADMQAFSNYMVIKHRIFCSFGQWELFCITCEKNLCALLKIIDPLPVI